MNTEESRNETDLISGTMRDRVQYENPSIERSWSWNESGDACDREIWSESGGVVAIAFLGSGTFSSCAVGCDAT